MIIKTCRSSPVQRYSCWSTWSVLDLAWTTSASLARSLSMAEAEEEEEEEDAVLQRGGPCAKCEREWSTRWRTGKDEHAGKPCCSKRQCKIFLKIERETPKQPRQPRQAQQAQQQAQHQAQPSWLPTVGAPPLSPALLMLVQPLTDSLNSIVGAFEFNARANGVSGNEFALVALQNAAILAAQRGAASMPPPAPSVPATQATNPLPTAAVVPLPPPTAGLRLPSASAVQLQRQHPAKPAAAPQAELRRAAAQSVASQGHTTAAPAPVSAQVTRSGDDEGA